MPYRGRALNWGLFLEPAMQGLATEANASARLGATIERGGGAIGQGFKDKRTEAESKRRFDSDLALRQKESARQDEELRLKQDELAFKKQEAQAFESELVDHYQSLGDLLTKEVTTEGQPKQETIAAAQQVDDILKSKGVDPLGILNERAMRSVSAPQSGPLLEPGGPITQVGKPGEPGWPKNHAQGDMTPWRTTGTAPAAKPAPMVPGMASLRAGAEAQVAAAPLVGERGVEIPTSESLAMKAEEIKTRLETLQTEATRARRVVDSKSVHGPKAKAAANLFLNKAESEVARMAALYRSYTVQAKQAAKVEAAAETQAREQEQETKLIASEKAAFLADKRNNPADVKRGEEAGITDSASWRHYLTAKAADAREAERVAKADRKESDKANADAIDAARKARENTPEAQADHQVKKEVLVVKKRLENNLDPATGDPLKTAKSDDDKKAERAFETLHTAINSEDKARTRHVAVKDIRIDDLGALARAQWLPPSLKPVVDAELAARRPAYPTQEAFDRAVGSPAAAPAAPAAAPKPAPAPAAPAAPAAPKDFAAVDAAVRKEFAGKTEKEIQAEVVRRMKGG